MNAPANAPATVPAETPNALSTQVAQPPSQMATSWLTPTNLASGLQIADLMAKCKLVPQHLQGSVSDCLLVLSQAARWGMDPFAVAQATAVVRGKLCFEGKLVAAALVATGAVEGGLDYEFEGDGQGMSVTITGTLRRTGKTKVLKGTVKGWRTENGQWDKDPQSMLVYRGSRQWARLYAPETILGVVTPDEATDMKDAEDVRVTSTVPETKAPKARGKAKDERAGGGRGPGRAGREAGGRPAAGRLVREAKCLHESRSGAAAEVRAIVNQLGVKKLQSVPANAARRGDRHGARRSADLLQAGGGG
jgi:hypothetical protein